MRTSFLIIFLFFYFFSFGKIDSSFVKPARLAIVGVAGSSALAGSFLYLKNSWWSENSSQFHFDDGSDLRYALNIDKAGHFMGGLIVSDIFQKSLNWSGLPENKAYFYGAAMGSFVQAAIEMKDAYAPYWGFSLWDFGAGSVGALTPIFKRYWKPMQYVEFKISYFKKSNHYWELGTQQKPYAPPHPNAYHDDYINQTYWVCFFPLRDKGDYIGLAFGVGLDDTQYLDITNTKRGGRNEFYIALDYDLIQLLNKFESPVAKKLKSWFKYIKLPAPTIRVSPSLEFYPFFM